MTNKDEQFELFFGIVAPVGIDTEKTFQAIEAALKKAKYKSHQIKLSNQLQVIEPSLKNISSEDIRISEHMKIGNEARVKIKRGDTVALLSLNEIKKTRQANKEDKSTVAYGNAYVFNSLKHVDEIATLKNIYGDHFFVISVYEPTHKRHEALTSKIKTSSTEHASSAKKEKAQESATDLIEKDKKDDPSYGIYGQSVRDTFPHADLFINQKKQAEQIERFIDLLFGARFITPTKDEYGMQLAQSVALKSADLSRQVGAVILDNRAGLISAGCNEVAQPQIGTFWEGDEYEDHRDFKKSVDSNVEKKNDLLGDLLRKLKENGWLNEDLNKEDISELVKMALYEPNKQFLKDSKVNDLLEFGRIVHAEMNAITDAARRGQKLLNNILYCTTFPCHGCARHIIASGIKRVVFIEPYPKSLTQELYTTMVKIDECPSDENHISFENFIGVAPKQYENLFSMLKRKDKRGNAVSEDYIDHKPRIKNPDVVSSYINEEDAFLLLTKKLFN